MLVNKLLHRRPWISGFYNVLILCVHGKLRNDSELGSLIGEAWSL